MNSKKVRRYVHSPFTIEENDTLRVECDKDGKVSIQQGGDEYEEVIIPASLVYKIANMLNSTKKIKYINREDIPKNE